MIGSMVIFSSILVMLSVAMLAEILACTPRPALARAR